MKVHLGIAGQTACGIPIPTLGIQTDAFLSEDEWDDLDTIAKERGIEASYCSTCAKIKEQTHGRTLRQ